MSSGKLPPALLARLQKRGIIPRQDRPNEQEEEVIAEDYDDPNVSKGLSSGGSSKEMAPGCPNKYNIYHDCSDYCHKKWGQGEANPSPSTQRIYQRLLKRYPLPVNWQQVWEPGLNRYYFWNTSTDEVSWFPPSHPKAKIFLPVPKLKALIKEEEEHQVLDGIGSEGEDGSNDEDDSNDSDSEMSSFDSMGSDEEAEGRKKSKEPHKSKLVSSQQVSLHKSSSSISNKSQGRKKVDRNDLDPMDPASYSDACPRGKWSDGLEKATDAKSGVDSTVSGPLFQMRPYPSPGAVLRMNKQ